MNPLRGILLKVLSVLVFTGMATIIKATAHEVPPGERVFFRSFFAIPVILGWMAARGHLGDAVRTANPMGHIWRGVAGTCGMGLGFLSLGLLPLPESTAIGYAAPLLATIFAAMFLGEQVRFYRLGAIAFGMVGVVIVLSPRLTLINHPEAASKLEMLGAMAALMAAVFAALAQTFVRKLVREEKTAAIVFYFSVTASVLALFTIPFGWVWPRPETAALLILAGGLGGLGQILLTECYRHADTGVIAPFEYVSMLLALGVGYWMFLEIPTKPMLIGAGLIVAAGLFVIWRERALGIERARARKAMTPQG